MPPENYDKNIGNIFEYPKDSPQGEGQESGVIPGVVLGMNARQVDVELTNSSGKNLNIRRMAHRAMDRSPK